MLNIITFREYTISAIPVPIVNGRWSARYTICRCGEIVRNSSEIPPQSSSQFAESAAILLAIQYVEEQQAMSAYVNISGASG